MVFSDLYPARYTEKINILANTFSNYNYDAIRVVAVEPKTMLY